MKNLFFIFLFFFILSSCDSFKNTETPETEPDSDQEIVIPVSSVSLSASVLELYIADSFQLVATVNPPDATYELKWWSDSPETATVDNNGLVTALSEGTANVSVQAGEQVASCAVTVSISEFSDYIDEYGVNQGRGVKIGETIWAPVNCGYNETDFRFGKLYQWGRKYGQSYLISGDESVIEIVEGPVSASDGQKYEYSNTFFISILEEYNYDWCSPQDDKLWNSGTDTDPIKTECDPCPEGWRVPTYSELWALRKNHSSWTVNPEGQWGYWFSGPVSYSTSAPQVFLPAGGLLGYASGDGRYRNSDGYYWSSMPYGLHTGVLSFSSLGVDIFGHSRANGQSIRCVQATDEVAEL